LGKQCFAFDKMEDSKTLIPAILTNLSWSNKSEVP
jgi:hypothetical protein